MKYLVLVFSLGAASLSAGTITVSATPNIFAPEAAALGGVTLGSFTDSDSSQTAGSFVATVNWGDATASAGALVSNGIGGFNVVGSHTYTDEGSYTFQLHIQDSAAGTGTGSGTATVNDAPLNLLSSIPSFAFTPGVAVSNVSLGTFSDPNPFAAPSDYSVIIAWGDATSSAGTITSSAGTVTALGSHTYVTGGNFTVGVTINDDGGSQVTFQSLAVSSVPEPGSMALMLSGLMLALLVRRNR